MIFGYTRVSSQQQSELRQVAELEKYVPNPKNIVCDKQSGKDFNREEYMNLRDNVLRKNDVLYIKELDRLGRNKEQVKQELQKLKNKGVIVRILDIPTTLEESEGWVTDMVTTILIEVLGTIAEQEREKILKRQREGIDQMVIIDGKKHSVKANKGATGRPKKPIPKDFPKYYKMVQEGQLKNDDVMKLLEIKKTRYYEILKQYKEENEGK